MGGGLTPAQAAQAWADPETFERTVVRAESYVIEELTAPSAGDVSTMAAMAQKTFTAVRQHITPTGVECFTLRIKKTFRYDQIRAYHDYSEVIPWANGWCGYHYTGGTGPTNQYSSIGGIPNSASITSATATFQDGWGSNSTIFLSAEGRYNGVTNYWSSIG